MPKKLRKNAWFDRKDITKLGYSLEIMSGVLERSVGSNNTSVLLAITIDNLKILINAQYEK